MKNKSQPWIGNAVVDSLFILLPPFFCLLIIAFFPSAFLSSDPVSTINWIILVVLIDVSHVYSTLYRTYFDPVIFRRQRMILLAIPFFAFIGGVLLYSLSSRWFWRILAYTAVFHFIRQQYGFMRVYSRYDKPGTVASRIDTLAIYTATLYPIAYWHLTGPKNFNWFIEEDFFYLRGERWLPVLTAIYFTIILTYLTKEIVLRIRDKTTNWPRFMLISGTFLSWYAGIVYFNGDLAFTLLNVVSHGVPYMALVWLYGKKNYSQGKAGRFLKVIFSRYGWTFFLIVLFILAFVEEGIWDRAVWKERINVFGTAGFSLSKEGLTILVPLLALPQLTHYILDGFIWKMKPDKEGWNNDIIKFK